MDKVEEKFHKVLESKIIPKVILVVGIFILIILIFSFGVAVGLHKASFGGAWREHYYENFGTPSRGMMGMWDADGFPNAHGAVGKIIKTEPSSIIVEDTKDNIEKVVSLSANTKIQKGSEDITAADLRIDDFVIVIGTPNGAGYIDAKLIRVLPNPESLTNQ